MKNSKTNHKQPQTNTLKRQKTFQQKLQTETPYTSSYELLRQNALLSGKVPFVLCSATPGGGMGYGFYFGLGFLFHGV